jgi:hypothetical protein
MNEIIIERRIAGWVATYTGPHAAEIIDLFGTDTIPMAFGAAAELPQVRAAIRALNPGIAVRYRAVVQGICA